MITLQFLLWFLLNWVLKILGLAFLLLFFLSVFSEIATYRKKKEIKIKTLWISVILAIVVLIIFQWVGKVNLAGSIWWLNYILIPLGGLVFGFFYGQTKKLSQEGKKVLGQGNVWYLVFWGVTTVLIQLMFLFNIGVGFNIAVSALWLSTSILVGNNIMMIIRSNSLRSSTAATGSVQK